jgi:choline dehydrogenase-like flavoprotein
VTRGWIHDLRSGGPTAAIQTDLCILGSGPVGLTLACAAANSGLSVTVLEIGGTTASIGAESPDLHFDRRTYRGATIGRALGLGGTSTLWGGQLLPVRPADLLARPQIKAAAWPIDYSQIEPHFGAMQAMLGLKAAGFDLRSLGGAARALSSLDFAGWAPRLSKWLAFGRRNMVVALRRQLSRHPGINVWLNTTVHGWSTTSRDGKQTVRELIAASSQGEPLRVHPRAVVIAAGALEAARSVLEFNMHAGSLGEGVGEFAGRFLHDHLSLRIARVRILDVAGFEERFSPYFEGSTMRSLRMELPPDVLETEGLPALYAHFIAEAPPASGFAVVRDCLRSAQRRDVGLACACARRVPGALPDIANLVYTRFVKHRLASPARSTYFLHVDLEQAPAYENRVYLGPSQDGRRPPLHIDWDVHEDAPRIARVVQRRFERFWAHNGLNKVAALEFLDFGDRTQAWNDNVHDLYHPAGTTRMASDPGLGVVDENLRIHRTCNAYVAGSSVFPSMGAANPTFTAMALALRLARHIGQTL